MGHHYGLRPGKKLLLGKELLVDYDETNDISESRDGCLMIETLELPVVKRGDTIEITIRDRNRKKRSSGPNEGRNIAPYDDEEVLAELFLGSRLLAQSNCDVFMAGICPARFQPVRRLRPRQHRPRRPVISAPCRQACCCRSNSAMLKGALRAQVNVQGLTDRTRLKPELRSQTSRVR